jgi:hypothetical protein
MLPVATNLSVGGSVGWGVAVGTGMAVAEDVAVAVALAVAEPVAVGVALGVGDGVELAPQPDKARVRNAARPIIVARDATTQRGRPTVARAG